MRTAKVSTGRRLASLDHLSHLQTRRGGCASQKHLVFFAGVESHRLAHAAASKRCTRHRVDTDTEESDSRICRSG